MEALMVDFTLAAERAGVMPAALESLKASYPGMDWENLAKVMISRVSRHGIRRAAEMREASRMIAELGLDSGLVGAIATGRRALPSSRRRHERPQRGKLGNSLPFRNVRPARPRAVPDARTARPGGAEIHRLNFGSANSAATE
jgi:hypothetical protein